jgi:uncharacterized protein
VLKVGYGVAMLGLAFVLLSDRPQPASAGARIVPVIGGASGAAEVHVIASSSEPPKALIVAESEHVHAACSSGEHRRIVAASGRVFDFCAHGLRMQRMMSGAGAIVAGMISTGVGEATLPPLVRRSRFPVPIAAATSTVIVAGTVAGAAATHLVELLHQGGVGAIPWNLLVWAVPGAVIGAFLGTRFQGKVSEKAARRFFAGLFAAIGIAFLLAFTVFAGHFG